MTNVTIQAKRIIETYCRCLLENNLEHIVPLFASQALIKSPLGQKDARTFYADLFKNSTRTRVDIQNLFCDIEDPYVFAALLNYEGTSNNKLVQFDCVDIFEFDDSLKIKKLTIIWDTYPVRSQVKI